MNSHPKPVKYRIVEDTVETPPVDSDGPLGYKGLYKEEALALLTIPEKEEK